MYPEIHRYYQLLDRDTSTVTSLWKVIHLTCLTISSISGFITAYSFGKSIEAFGDNCILNAKIEFTGVNYTKLTYFVTNNLPHDLKPIDMAASEWSYMKDCYFCQFTPLVSMIYAIIWSAFFIICSRGGAGYITDAIYRPWRIVYPAMFFSAIATVVMLISSVQMSSGINVFCSQFEVVFNTTKCTTMIDLYTLTFFPQKKQFISLLRISIFCSFTCFMGWLILLVVLILRVVCIADFQMIRITVTPKEEEILDIINADDLDDSSLLSSEDPSFLEETPSSRHRFFSFLPRHRKTSITPRTTFSSHDSRLDMYAKTDEEKRKKHRTVAFDVSDSSDDFTKKKKGYMKDEEDDEDLQQDAKRKRKSSASPQKSIFSRSGHQSSASSGLGFFHRPSLFAKRKEEASDNTSVGSASIDSFVVEGERQRKKSDSQQKAPVSARRSAHLFKLYEEDEVYKPESSFALVDDSRQKRKSEAKSPSSVRTKELEKVSWSTTTFPFTPVEEIKQPGTSGIRSPEPPRRGFFSRPSTSAAQPSVQFQPRKEQKQEKDDSARPSVRFDDESIESSESSHSLIQEAGKRSKKKKGRTHSSISSKSSVSSKGSVSSKPSVSSRSSRKSIGSKKSDSDRPTTSGAQSTAQFSQDEDGEEFHVTALPLLQLEESNRQKRFEMKIPDSSQPSIAPRPTDTAGSSGIAQPSTSDSHDVIDVSVQTMPSNIIKTLSEQKEKKKRKEKE